jgi:hypothetical protein
MESVRLHVQDSLYALLVTYLTLQSRDIFTNFLSVDPNSRVCTIDDIAFKIVRRMIGEPHEVPGVNLMMYDERSGHGFTNRQQYSRLATIHIYINESTNVNADDRTLMKLQRLIDEALYGKGLNIVDFYSDPPVHLQGTAFWDLLNPMESWNELTDLSHSPYLHRVKNLHVSYADDSIT